MKIKATVIRDNKGNFDFYDGLMKVASSKNEHDVPTIPDGFIKKYLHGLYPTQVILEYDDEGNIKCRKDGTVIVKRIANTFEIADVIEIIKDIVPSLSESEIKNKIDEYLLR